jgi:hypothetical protein
MRPRFLDVNKLMVTIMLIVLALFAEWILFTTLKLVFGFNLSYWYVYLITTIVIFINNKKPEINA